jgi:hypothetical protein
LKRLQPPWHPLTTRRNSRLGQEALQRRDLSVNEREEIYWAILSAAAPLINVSIASTTTYGASR